MGYEANYFMEQMLLVTSCRLAHRSNTAHSPGVPHARKKSDGKWQLIIVGYNKGPVFDSNERDCAYSGMLLG